MSLIFFGSTDALSEPNTSRFLGPFLNWLFPGIDPSIIDGLRFGIRKCGHLTEYAILALLMWRGFQRPTRFFAPPDHKPLVYAFVSASLYAVTDEFHQSLIPSRYGSIIDVMIDASGAALGLLGYKWAHQWVAGRRSKRPDLSEKT